MSEAKLTGAAYRTYWEDRMARGPAQAAHDGLSEEAEAQADCWWAALQAVLGPCTDPFRVVELGSGYGRMLRRMRRQWPEAYLFGYELAPAAVQGAWTDDRSLSFSIDLVAIARADLYVTCTALQHITDDAVLYGLVHEMQRAAPHGARLALLENVAQPGAAHVRDMTIDAWRAVFRPFVTWDAEVLTDWRGQAHVALGGTWR